MSSVCEVPLAGIFPMRLSPGALHREAAFRVAIMDANQRFAKNGLPLSIVPVIQSSSSALKNSDPGPAVLNLFDVIDTVVGIVGAAYSDTTIAIQHVVKLYGIPQISYSSTSAILSDKTNFPSFSRVVPSDAQQGAAIAQLISKFEWKSVALIGCSDLYCLSGLEVLNRELTVRAPFTSVVFEKRFNRDTVDIDGIDEMLLNIQESRTRIIVLFALSRDVTSVLTRAHALNMRNEYVWILSDGGASRTYSDIGDFTGMIAISPARPSGALYNEFLDRWQSTYNQPEFIHTTEYE
jgi:ABC-type branched-subunit amino acid transport system substrate-binding protein